MQLGMAKKPQWSPLFPGNGAFGMRDGEAPFGFWFPHIWGHCSFMGLQNVHLNEHCLRLTCEVTKDLVSLEWNDPTEAQRISTHLGGCVLSAMIKTKNTIYTGRGDHDPETDYTQSVLLKNSLSRGAHEGFLPLRISREGPVISRAESWER